MPSGLKPSATAASDERLVGLRRFVARIQTSRSAPVDTQQRLEQVSIQIIDIVVYLQSQSIRRRPDQRRVDDERQEYCPIPE